VKRLLQQRRSALTPHGTLFSRVGFYADMARAAREKLARGSESDSIPPSVEPATPSPLGGEVFEADMELNTDRPGYDYRNFDLTTPDPRLCKAQCEAEAPCPSWTYVLPGVQAANARCWLKKAVPRTLANGCCVSGIKRLGQARRAR
jgi:PAN domain